MSEQLSENGKDLVRYMPQAVNALADRLIEKLEERLLYGEKPKTNADRIRQMSDEELADIMGPYECVGCPVETETGECLQEGENCYKALLRWLKSPAEEGEG